MGRDEIVDYICDSDIFASATLGEGSSASRALALCLGIPMLTTAYGELADDPGVPHVRLVPTGDAMSFHQALCSLAADLIAGRHVGRREMPWRAFVADSVLRRNGRHGFPYFVRWLGMPRNRVLLSCHDGTGLGHLRRISRLAGVLQGQFSTLVLCGMREAAWIVPQECGFIRLPGIGMVSIAGALSVRGGRPGSIFLAPTLFSFALNRSAILRNSFDPMRS